MKLPAQRPHQPHRRHLHPRAAADGRRILAVQPALLRRDGKGDALVRRIPRATRRRSARCRWSPGLTTPPAGTELLIDKLGERLALGRRGDAALYEALMLKHGAPLPVGAGSAGVSASAAMRMPPEYRHFMLLSEAIEELGAEDRAPRSLPRRTWPRVISEGFRRWSRNSRQAWFSQCLSAVLVASSSPTTRAGPGCSRSPKSWATTSCSAVRGGPGARAGAPGDDSKVGEGAARTLRPVRVVYAAHGPPPLPAAARHHRIGRRRLGRWRAGSADQIEPVIRKNQNQVILLQQQLPEARESPGQGGAAVGSNRRRGRGRRGRRLHAREQKMKQC